VTSCRQGRSDGGISVYIPPPPKKNSLPYKFIMWLLVVFFSLTQDKFDIVPVCALIARVSFTYLHTTIYTPPPNEIPGYTPACRRRRLVWSASSAVSEYQPVSRATHHRPSPITGRCASPTAAAEVWNSLPEAVVSSSSLLTFRRHLKTHFSID